MKEHLSVRENWQEMSGANAAAAEKSVFEVFQALFEGTDYRIRAKPNEFSHVYTKVVLGEDDLKEIYSPEKEITKHGFSPDYAIDNLKTKKTLYVEVKRQDGWIAGGLRKDGRGNAHERSCKFFTPGLLELLREKGGHPPDVLPFWTVFQGNITCDPCRVREIRCWYKGFDDHCYFWRDTLNPKPLIKHFQEKLLGLIA